MLANVTELWCSLKTFFSWSISITSDLPCCSFKQQQRQHHPSQSLPRLSAFVFFTKTTPPLDSSQLEGKAKARRWWKSGCRRRSGESPRGAAGSVRTRFHYSPTVPTVVLTFTSENTNANVRAPLRGKSDDRQSPDLIQWHGAQRRSRLCLGVAGWCRWGRRRLPHTHTHTPVVNI